MEKFKFTKEEIKVMEKYKIKYEEYVKKNEIEELIELLEDKCLDYHDEYWEPLDEWYELERTRDTIANRYYN